MRWLASWRLASASSSVSRRALIASRTSCLASLMAAPAAGRSSAGKPPRVFSCSVREPFLPRKRTRRSSSSCKASAAAIAASASCFRVSSCAISPYAVENCHRRRKPEDCGADETADSSGERGLGLGDYCCKGVLVVHGQVSQYATVDTNAGLFQTGDQPAVADVVDTCLGVDTGDPQATEYALLLLAVTIGVLPRLGDCLLGDAQYAATETVVALGLLENLLVTAACGDATFYSCHCIAPLPDQIGDNTQSSRNMRFTRPMSDG